MRELATIAPLTNKLQPSFSHELRNPLQGLKGSVNYVTEKIAALQKQNPPDCAAPGGPLCTDDLDNLHEQLVTLKTNITQLTKFITFVLDKSKAVVTNEVKKDVKVEAKTFVIEQTQQKEIAEQCLTLCHSVAKTLQALVPHTLQLVDVNIFLDGMKSSVNHLNKLIQPLVNHQTTPIAQDSQLIAQTVVRDVVLMHTAQIKEKNLRIDVVVDKEIPVLMADTQRFKQVLINFLANAIKSTAVGVITITVEIVKQTATDVTLKVSVKDTGKGMSPETCSRVGEVYFQAKDEQEGTGLGLAICKQLITENLHGTFVASSDGIDRGSTFAFTLTGKKLVMQPITQRAIDLQLQQRPISPAKKAAEKIVCPLLKGKVILVVDDDKINRVILQRMLETEGAHCVLAENGQEAIDQYVKITKNTSSGQPIILMDKNMPVMDGVTAAHKIHALDPNACIIGLSGESKEENIDSAAIKAWLGKPYNKAKLFKTIDETVNVLSARETVSAALIMEFSPIFNRCAPVAVPTLSSITPPASPTISHKSHNKMTTLMQTLALVCAM